MKVGVLGWLYVEHTPQQRCGDPAFYNINSAL